MPRRPFREKAQCWSPAIGLFQMHQRYIHLQRNDIAKAFGILQHGCNKDSPAEEAVS
jgi:hypothetical protein